MESTREYLQILLSQGCKLLKEKGCNKELNVDLLMYIRYQRINYNMLPKKEINKLIVGASKDIKYLESL